jgi:hypothetical protein
MNDKKTNIPKPICSCVNDPFADLPPELRPKPVEKFGGLRKVTCPGCGLEYWTNRKGDLCIDCEKKGVRIAETKDNSEDWTC